MTDCLSLKGARVDCIVGLQEGERHAPQPVALDVVLHFDTREAAKLSQLAYTVDYARLLGELRFILLTAHFYLLESAAQALAAWLLAPPTQDAPRAAVRAVDVRLSKLAALAYAAIPTVEIHRTHTDFHLVSEAKNFGTVDVIFETKACGVYRERISPHTVLPTHIHQHIDETELVLGDGLLLQGKAASAGWAHAWPRGYPHRYENVTDIEQSFLCVDRPAFIPSDELQVNVPIPKLRRTPGQRFF